MKAHVPSLVGFLVVLAAILNAGGWSWEWFNLVWYDELVHAFSSLAVVAALVCMAWGSPVLHRISAAVAICAGCMTVVPASRPGVAQDAQATGPDIDNGRAIVVGAQTFSYPHQSLQGSAVPP